MIRKKLVVAGTVALLSIGTFLGCGKDTNCAVKGDNIKGHINFTNAIAPTAGKNIIIQYSTDNFSTVKDSKTMYNLQGLVTVPYSFCIDNDVNAVLRAFQDDNKDGTWQSGEGAGRDDGTSTGNATYTTHNLPAPQSNTNPPVEWKIDKGVDIWIDTTTAQ